MTIGVLDDNPVICQLMETLLSFEGHVVYTSTDPTDFVAFLCLNKIDNLECIVVDFHLPGERSGVDVIRQVRLAYPHLPAVLISANSIPQATLQGLRGVEILRTPFPTSMLLEAITITQERSTRPVQ